MHAYDGAMTSGRVYRTQVELTYLGGTIPTDTAAALAGALREDSRHHLSDLSFAVSQDQHSVVRLGATIRADSPVAALTAVNTSVDRSLLSTGLFDEFDVTGKVLRIAPLEQLDRPYQTPAG